MIFFLEEEGNSENVAHSDIEKKKSPKWKTKLIIQTVFLPESL